MMHVHSTPCWASAHGAAGMIQMNVRQEHGAEISKSQPVFGKSST